MLFAAIGLDDRPHTERSNVHKPVATELGVARKNLPFVVGIYIWPADERYRIYGVVFAGDCAHASSRTACIGEVEAVVIDRRETDHGYVVSTGRCVVVENLAEAARRSLERERGVGIGVEVEHEPSIRGTYHTIAYRARPGFQPAGEEVVEGFVA